MNSIGLIININKYITHYSENRQFTFICNDLEDVKNILINHLVTIFQNLEIDFPEDFDDFSYIWFNQQYTKCNVFDYKIFINNKWEEPWELQEIYSEVLEKMYEEEIKNPPDFSKIYDEDKDINDENNFIEKPSDQINELEKCFRDIIEQAKHS